jgi:hypothetical protein
VHVRLGLSVARVLTFTCLLAPLTVQEYQTAEPSNLQNPENAGGMQLGPSTQYSCDPFVVLLIMPQFWRTRHCYASATVITGAYSKFLMAH